MEPKRNNHLQFQWIEEKEDCSIQMFWYTIVIWNQVWMIEVEEDLLVNTTQSIKPINENDGAQEKQLLLISMDWREGRLLNSIVLALLNAALPSMIDWSWGKSKNRNQSENHTNQWEWSNLTETEITHINGPNRSNIREFKWFDILECLITKFDWLKLREI